MFRSVHCPIFCKAVFLLVFCYSLPDKGAAQPSVLNFSGYSWSVADGKVTPGLTNNFISDQQMQFVDPKGRLHLKIKKKYGIWYCSQIKLKKPLGNGTYQLTIDSGTYAVDPRLLFSFAITDDINSNGIIEASQQERELNLSLSRWNQENNMPLWYMIRPLPGQNQNTQIPQTFYPNVYAFPTTISSAKIYKHTIGWPDGKTVQFSSRSKTASGQKYTLMCEKKMTGINAPRSENAVVTVSFYIVGSNIPQNDGPQSEYEIIIKSVSFTPAR